MTREEKIAEARRLQSEGLNNREIGDQLGVTASCVWRWVNPESAREKSRRDNARPEARARKRASSRRRRARCPRCGEPRGVGSAGTAHPGKLCRSCERSDRTASRVAIDDRVEALWNQGERTGDIATEIGATDGAVRVRINRMRKEGRSLPYRYSFPNREPAHPELAEVSA